MHYDVHYDVSHNVYYSAVKRNELLIHQVTQMKLKNTVLSKRSQTLRVHFERLHFCEVLEKESIYSKHVKLKGYQD